MSTTPSHSRHLPVLVLSILGVLPAIACGAVSTVGGVPRPTPTATATSAPTTCAELTGFATATPASPVSGFNYGLPTNTVATAPTTTAGGAGQYTLYDMDLCTPHTTTDLPEGATPRPLATALQFYGWGPMPAFPTGGDALQACPSGDTCYGYELQTKSGAPYFTVPEQFLAFGNVQDRGNGLVTYHLKLADAPPTLACTDPNLTSFEHYMYAASPVYLPFYGAPTLTAGGTYSGLQLPPMTRMYSESGAGRTNYHMCSAGTGASINAFMYTQLTTNSWGACSGQPAPSPSGGCYAITYNVTCGSTTTSMTQTITLAATNPTAWGWSSVHQCFG